MIERRSKLRAFWLLYALLQLVLPGAASIADASLEAASIRARPTSHIEEHDGANCARIHPEDCALCRILSASATPPTARATVPVAPLRIAPPMDGVVRVSRALHHATRSRAPPVVV